MPEEKQGKALESLVASLEKALADTPNVKVHSPMRLPDRTTGKLREHDVVLELNEGHHSLLIAIECRDRSRPIGVPQVEAFGAKCLDTGINQGIIVSTMGFYNTAKTKADHLGIRCLDIEEVDNFEWLLAQGIYATTTRLLRNDWTFFPQQDGIVPRKEFQVVDKEGNMASMAALTANAQMQLTKILPEIPEPVEDQEITIKRHWARHAVPLRWNNSVARYPVRFRQLFDHSNPPQPNTSTNCAKHPAQNYGNAIIGNTSSAMNRN